MQYGSTIKAVAGIKQQHIFTCGPLNPFIHGMIYTLILFTYPVFYFRAMLFNEGFTSVTRSAINYDIFVPGKGLGKYTVEGFLMDNFMR